MQRNNKKRVTSLILTFSLVLGLLGTLTALKAGGKNSADSLNVLQKWYSEYSQTGNTGDDINPDADGIVRQQRTYYLGNTVWVVQGVKNKRLVCARVSIGYRAYKVFHGNRANGFVTVAHAVKDSSDNYLYRTSGRTDQVGRIEAWRYDSYADVSFISVNSQKNTISTKTAGGVTISPTIKTVKAGDKVSTCGGVSGTVNNKIVYDASKSATVDGLYMTDLIRTACMSKAGDSGAPVYYKNGSKYLLVGIIVGGDLRDYTFVEKAANLKSRFGVTPY